MAGEMKQLTKKQMAEMMGFNRSFLYYQSNQTVVDGKLGEQIGLVMGINPGYGHRRIALAFGAGKVNRKRVLRVMKKFNLKPKISRKRLRKKKDENRPVAQYSNLVELVPQQEINKPDLIWVSDFTYLKFRQTFIYLATILDQFTREVVGWQVSSYHNQALVLGALVHALGNKHYHLPEYLHSDQGSEYDSQTYTELAESLGIQISMSRKKSPWENPHQESFYSHFKLESNNFKQLENSGEFIEAIYQAINYYNNRRIHTALKMSPSEFRRQFNQAEGSDCVF